MCGRTCLTLDPQQILKACKYRRRRKHENHPDTNDLKKNDVENNGNDNNDDDIVEPEWRCEFNCGRKYIPSFNLAPTDVTPVLVSHKHFTDDKTMDSNNNKWLVVPMMWGMIPFWHKGEYKNHGLSTNNCRLENIQESKLYSRALKRGQRCVVLCEGFYEWQTTKTIKISSNAKRPAYLIYMPQGENVKIYDHNTWNAENINLLKMAGLFDIWEDANGDKIYSYSIITRESTDVISWLHHRMPIILQTQQQVDNWLDFHKIPNKEALETAIHSPIKLQWHQVANIVNNSRNKSDQCNKPIEMIQTPKKEMNKFMANWLSTATKRKGESIDATESSKLPNIKRSRLSNN